MAVTSQLKQNDKGSELSSSVQDFFWIGLIYRICTIKNSSNWGKNNGNWR